MKERFSECYKTSYSFLGTERTSSMLYLAIDQRPLRS